MKQNRVFIMLGVFFITSLLFTSCGDAAKIEELNDKISTLKNEKSELRSEKSNLETSLSIANAKIDNIPAELRAAVDAYIEEELAKNERLRLKGLLEIPITKIHPKLEFSDWTGIQNSIDFISTGNQIPNVKQAFFYCFSVDGDKYSEKERQIWSDLKVSFRTHPELFLNFFDSIAPQLKVLKESLFGIVINVVKQETKQYLNKEFSPELEAEFLKIYEVNPFSAEEYLLELKMKEDSFEKFGYEKDPNLDTHSFFDTEARLLTRDFMHWVWLYEYKKPLDPLIKRFEEL